MRDESTFFSASDGFTTTARYNGSDLTGILDADLADYYLDNSGPSEERYSFLVPEFSTWRESVGDTLTIGTDTYTITDADPDGTGLVTLKLYL